MKKTILTYFILFLAVSVNSFSQSYDIGEKPEPLEKKEFVFPEYEEVVLDNGLRVFLIEDNEQPTLSFSILFPGGEALESKKEAASFTARLLTKGTENKTALQIAEELDGVGAGISASASTEYCSVSGSSLMKHREILFNNLADILTKSTFPNEELEKLKPQAKASIKSSKGDPGTLARNMAVKALFGDDHPYAKVSTEESVDNIKRQDILDYYENFFIPNAGIMAIIGDFETNEMVDELKKYFAGWEKGESVNIKIPDPKPMPKGIYFIERQGSVQSSVRFANMTVPYKDDMYLPTRVAAHILSSSFAGRMFKTIREKYSYTYSPMGYQTSNKFHNYHLVGSDVRNEVTDSTILKMKGEVIGDLVQNGPDEKELETIKQFRIGQFYLAFESAEYIANIIQRAHFRGIPIRKLKRYPEEYKSITTIDVKKAASQYLNPEDSYIVVVGDPSVKESLERFGKIYTYDKDYKPVSGLEEADISADELISNYRESLGGEDNMSKINLLQGKGKVQMSASGNQFDGTLEIIYKSPNKYYRLTDLGIFKSEELYNGTKGWEKSSNSGTVELQGERLESMKFNADMFNYANYKDYGYTLEIKGKKDGFIIADLIDKNDNTDQLYFDENTFLLKKIESVDETPRGPMMVTIKYDDYKEISGVKFPTKLTSETPVFNIESSIEYKVNEGNVPEDKFTLQKKQNNSNKK